MICNVCGHTSFEEATVSRSFEVQGRLVLVEAIPAHICAYCGETNFDAEVSERIRQLVHGPHTPERVIETQVLRYDAA